MASEHYFQAQPAVASRPGTVHLRLADLTAELAVDRGVFSAGRIDPGTLVLLRALPPLPAGAAGAVLDLGCGYGPISCALAHRSPASLIWAVDVNQRALDLAATNAAALGLGNVRTATPAAVPADLRFDAIVSNPPIRVGKDALHDLLEQWLPRLSPAGDAWLVVHRHLGADSLGAWLTAGGWAVDRCSSKQGYRVLRVRRPLGAQRVPGARQPCGS